MYTKTTMLYSHATPVDHKSIDAFAMWSYQRVLKLSWMERITNVLVLQSLVRKSVFFNENMLCLQRIFGHSQGQKSELLGNIMQSEVKEKT